VKGTRLWQRAGSPLIQGRSRYARPFSTDWLRAGAAGIAAGALVSFGFLVVMGVDVPTAARAVWIPVIAVAIPAAALGVLIARRLGWRAPWRLGAGLSAILAIPAVAWFSLYLVGQLSG